MRVFLVAEWLFFLWLSKTLMILDEIDSFSTHFHISLFGFYVSQAGVGKFSGNFQWSKPQHEILCKLRRPSFSLWRIVYGQNPVDLISNPDFERVLDP